MTTIVVNTQTGAVSEYDWAFDSLSPGHGASSDGLFELGGDTDAGEPIAASITTGTTLCGTNLKKRVPWVYFSMTGEGQGKLRVLGSAVWSYLFPVRSGGQSRALPGKGIRENYLGFGFDNVAGADFRLDLLEIELVASQTRKVG